MSNQGLINEKPLPNSEFETLWERIILPDSKKKRLLNQIVLELSVRPKLKPGEVPLHGVILLVGPPGTGKTSLAKAVASKAATIIKGKKIRFLEVEPHSLVSSALGKSQKAVRTLLHETIAAEASKGPLIVLLDEVETLAASRVKLSLEANPVDVHRATDAVLAGLDMLAAEYPELLFIATSNFKNAVDEALISRADLVLHIDLPDDDARYFIVSDSLKVLEHHWKGIGLILKSEKELRQIAKAASGLDARRIRKAVISACALRTDSALDPGKLTIDDIKAAFANAMEGME